MNNSENTNSSDQVSVRVIPGGCVTEKMAADLESSIIVEINSNVQGTGSLNVLSTAAIQQVINTLVRNGDFQDTIANILVTSQVLSAAIETLTNEAFAENVECISNVTAPVNSVRQATYVFENDPEPFIVQPIFGLGALTGGGDLSEFFQVNATANSVTYQFPNANVGGSVTATLIKIRCSNT